VNSMPLRESSRSLAAQLDRSPIRVKPAEVRTEIQRRTEQRERAAAEQDYAKFRRQQTGRGGLLNFVQASRRRWRVRVRGE
jgi:hypothetical protein